MSTYTICLFGFLYVMGGYNHSQFAIPRRLHEKVPDSEKLYKLGYSEGFLHFTFLHTLFTQHGVQTHSGLVQNEKLRIVDHGAGEGQATLLSTAALLDHLPSRWQLQQLLEQLELLPDAFVCQAVDATEVEDCLLDGHLLDQGNLLRHESHSGSWHAATRLSWLGPKHDDLAAVEAPLADDAGEQGCLSASGGTQQSVSDRVRKEFSLIYRKNLNSTHIEPRITFIFSWLSTILGFDLEP